MRGDVGRERGGGGMTKRPVRVWDLPLRLFHWSLALVLTGSFLSVQAGEMELHQTFGFLAATLVLWRLIWGFAGSGTAPTSAKIVVRTFGWIVKGCGSIV